jgi:hypothetical protein
MPDEQFWTELLRRIRTSKVIPVVGQGAITHGSGSQFLYPELVRELAKELVEQGLLDSAEPEPRSLSELVRVLHRKTAPTNSFPQQLGVLRMSVQDYLQRTQPTPSPNLRLLTAIPRFRFYLSATVDSLLANAVDLANPVSTLTGAESTTCQLAFTDDLPTPFEKLQRSFVYPLFGRADLANDIALWEEDAFEFLLRLGEHLRNAPHLKSVLKDASFLFLGPSYADWMLRLLVRIAEGEPLVNRGNKLFYLADNLKGHRSRRVIAFFNPHTSLLKVVSIDPPEFIAQLAERWNRDAATRNPQPGGTPPSLTPFTTIETAKPGCIFVSYASSDRPLAEKAVRQIEQAEGFTWFDRWGIKPGDKWDRVLRDAVMRDCGVFVSLISRNTEQKVEGYYIRERNWAAHRYESFAQRAKFYFPVRLDEGPLIPDNEPLVASDFQAVLALNGELSEALVKQIVETQRTYCKQQGIPLPARG